MYWSIFKNFFMSRFNLFKEVYLSWQLRLLNHAITLIRIFQRQNATTCTLYDISFYYQISKVFYINEQSHNIMAEIFFYTLYLGKMTQNRPLRAKTLTKTSFRKAYCCSHKCPYRIYLFIFKHVIIVYQF